MSSVASRVQTNQQQQKANHDGKRRLRKFDIGDTVYVKNFTETPAWVPGVIKKCRGPLSYLIKLLNDKIVRRHVDHVKIRLSKHDISDSDDEFLLIGDQASSPVVKQSNTTEAPDTVELRCSARVRRPPDRWSPDDTSS